MERHLGGVDLVIRTVVYVRVDADNRIAAQRTGLHRFLNTVVDRRDVFLRDRAADDRALELVKILAIRIHRSEDALAVTVLAVAAGLLRVLVLLLHLLRRADVRLHMELAEQTVDDDFQMQLAHAGDDGLAGLRIRVLLEGRILLGQLAQRDAQLFLASLGLRLDRQLDDRLRELHGLQNDRSPEYTLSSSIRLLACI